MTVTNLTAGRSTWPTYDPITEGYRQLFQAVLIRAARDVKLESNPDAAADAAAFLAMPEARELAKVVGLLPGEGR